MVLGSGAGASFPCSKQMSLLIYGSLLKAKALPAHERCLAGGLGMNEAEASNRGLPAPISRHLVVSAQITCRGATLSKRPAWASGGWTRGRNLAGFDGTLALSPLCVKEDALNTNLRFYIEMLFFFNYTVVDQTLHNKPQIGLQPAPEESI